MNKIIERRMADRKGRVEAQLDRDNFPDDLSQFKVHLPYHESDHVLNLADNALCGGTCLEDLELRRQDEAYSNLLGAQRIPDPTTAGDFCRRSGPEHLRQQHEAFDATRRKSGRVSRPSSSPANNFMRIPAQVVNTGRRVIVRLLAWNLWQPIFFRLAGRFTRPRRC